MLLGAIADDLTGATDLALMLARSGMRTVQIMGVPENDALPDADAIVVALKSRTIAPALAVSQSLACARTLRAAGARQIFFKYCSTFDSTDEGNIGPVTEALMQELGATLTIACPAFPANARTIYQGHLFVGQQLLSDSPMRDHPLNPMRDSNLVRVLQRQTTRKVGLIAIDIVEGGADAIRGAFSKAQAEGLEILIIDAITDENLYAIGEAVADLPLLTGGSGVAIGLPENFRRAGLIARAEPGLPRPAPSGRALILAGSCSAATRGQVADASTRLPSLRISPSELAAGSQSVAQMVSWAVGEQPDKPVMIYSSAAPNAVRAAQEQLGREGAAEIVEQAMAGAATALVAKGFSRIIVAGGETSGAVVEALGVKVLAIGPEIDPGVPWTLSLDGPDVALALKSGNFGSQDFFSKAWGLLR
jgi:uncharacterized protein YgbK (DUF1537 family)